MLMCNFIPRTLISLLCILSAVLTLWSKPIYAQKPVNGNGTIIEQVRPMAQFKSISLDFTADLVIVNGETPSFHIKGEENILPHIGTQVRGGTLYISQDRWIEPSQRVVIRVGTPFTSSITTSGYSDVTVENAKGPRLQLEIGVGDIKLDGAVDRVQVHTKTGSIDAQQLRTSYAEVRVYSYGTVLLGDIEELVAEIDKQGTIVYRGTPVLRIKNDNHSGKILHESDYEKPGDQDVIYIPLTLVNNSRRKASFRVEGPKIRSFGYGFSMSPGTKRREDWPIGTRLYKDNLLLSEELLLTVSEDMQGQLVDLFSKE